MAFEKLTNSIQQLNKNIQTFAQSNAEYYKLKFFKQAVQGGSSLILGLTLAVLVFFALVFLSVAVAIAISEAIGNPSSGFFIVAGFYFLLFLLILIFGKKPLQKILLKKTSKAFFKD